MKREEPKVKAPDGVYFGAIRAEGNAFQVVTLRIKDGQVVRVDEELPTLKEIVPDRIGELVILELVR